MLAFAVRRHLADAGFCRYADVGGVDAPVCFIEGLPTTISASDAMAVYVSPGSRPGVTDQFEQVTVRVIVRMDGPSSAVPGRNGYQAAESVRNALHGLGADGYPFTLGGDGDEAAVVSNIVARDSAPVPLGVAPGESIPRWLVAFYVDVANESPERAALAG